MLPGSVAPWTKKTALSTQVQEDVATVNVEEDQPGDFSLQVAIEMPYDIKTLHSPTHNSLIRIKVTVKKYMIIFAGFNFLCSFHVAIFVDFQISEKFRPCAVFH